MTEEKNIEDLTEEEIEEAIRDGQLLLAEKRLARLRGEPWGHCECGEEFTLADKGRFMYCPKCGRKLKDE